MDFGCMDFYDLFVVLIGAGTILDSAAWCGL